MVLDQPGDRFSFGGGKAKTRAQLAGDNGPGDRIIFRPALVDVVQQKGNISQCAKVAGLTRYHLRELLKKHGIKARE